MATIFKRRKLRPVPPQASVTERRGKRRATWRDASGNTHTCDVVAIQGGPHHGEHRVVLSCDKKWSLKFRDETGAWVEKTGYTDKQATERLASRLEDEARKRSDGLIDGRAERYAAAERRTIAEHVEDWRADLAAKGRASKTVNLTTRRVEKLLTIANPDIS